MDIRQNPLWLSFSVGRLFRTDVRVNVWYFMLPLVFCMKLGWKLGLVVSGLLFLITLVHEFAHVFAARKTGGSANEILVWPLGGLAFAAPGPTFPSEIWTIGAGPLSNALMCVICLPVAISTGKVSECFRLISLPQVDLAHDTVRSLLLLLTSLNFTLLILNLIPVFPLDGGQMAYAWAKQHWDRQTARIGTLWLGIIGCIFLCIAGAVLEIVFLILMGSILCMFCMHEYFSAQLSRHFDDSFLGYDFSQGYTSLEGGQERESSRHPGPIERWRQARAQKKREREEQQRLETERRVDELLDKVHQHGMNSLTDAERRFLHRASGRYRSHDQG